MREKPSEQISLMQNLDQTSFLGSISTSEAESNLFIPCEDIGWSSWFVAERVAIAIWDLALSDDCSYTEPGCREKANRRDDSASLRWETAKLCSQPCVEGASHNHMFWETCMAARLQIAYHLIFFWIINSSLALFPRFKPFGSLCTSNTHPPRPPKNTTEQRNPSK